jgi:hypothetical protein
MFQSLTGSAGHLAALTREGACKGSVVSIPNGLRRPFSRPRSSCFAVIFPGFNP